MRFANFFLPLESSPVPVPPQDLFCAGHAWSPFGYLVVAGGTRYVPAVPDNAADLVFTFDPRFPNLQFPTTGQLLYSAPGIYWQREPVVLPTPRYYPTLTLTHRLPRNVPTLPPFVEAMLVCGGSAVGSVPGPEWNSYEAMLCVDATVFNAQRVFNDSVNGSSIWWGPSNPNAVPYDPYFDSFVEYPRMHLASNGRVFMSGDATRSAQIDHSFAPGTVNPAPYSATGTWSQQWNQAAGVPAPTSLYRHASSSVLFVNGTGIADLVVRIGGENGGQALSSVEVASATSPGQWIGAPQVPTMAHAREHANAVILPDLSVFVVGGHNGGTSVYEPEVLKWGTGSWQVQPAASSPRNYHSTAVLLPDGRVLVGGGNDRHPDPASGFDYEIFEPHYLVGNPPPVRPQSLDIPNATQVLPDGTYLLSRNGVFDLLAGDMPIDAKLGKLVLIAPGSTTHHSDMHQRYVECSSTPVSTKQLSFTVPSETQAPRGFYMAFAVTTAGIPAEAIWVWLQ